MRDPSQSLSSLLTTLRILYASFLPHGSHPLPHERSLLPDDLKRLPAPQWFNDSLLEFGLSYVIFTISIAFWLILLIYRLWYERFLASKGHHLRTLLFSTQFYSTLRDKGYSAVASWNTKSPIFGYDILVIPCHLGQHWIAAMVCKDPSVVKSGVPWYITSFSPSSDFTQ